jgi:predicted dehydrogenase
MRTIRWGIIGCGDVTEVKSGPGFQNAANSQLLAVMRRNAVLAEDYAQRHKVPKWYDNAEALIHDPEVDAVYIATPPAAHKDYTLMAASADKPVYVEKPMALNAAECKIMIEACAQAGVPLFVAYYRRALPRFLKVKELIDTRAIGEIRLVTVTLYQPAPETLSWRLDPAISGGGLFVDLASHTLDFLDYVLGPVESIEGFAANQARISPAEDIVTGVFRFASGVQATGSWCFSAFERCDKTEIIGNKGKITFSIFDTSPIMLTTSTGTREYAIDHPQHVQQPLIQSVVDHLNGQGVCPSTGNSAIRTTLVMDKLLNAYYGKDQS